VRRLMCDQYTLAAHRFAYSFGRLKCISIASSVESETVPVDTTVDVEIDVRRFTRSDCNVESNGSGARVYIRFFNVV
jgi:hypothetical protein